jgi:predicted permease
VLADLRYALRALRRHPGFAAAVAGMLALGIGANTAIFSVVDAVLLRGLPYPASERLVMAFTTYPDFGHSSTSLEDFRDWRDGFRGAGELAAFANASFNVTGDGAPERAVGAAVTANYFRVLGAPPSLGRAFLDEEERGGAPRVVMLGHEYWRSRFGADPGVVGRTLTLNGIPRTVVGVGPAGLVLPRAPDVLVPQRTDTTFGRRSEFLTVVGRLAPGASVERARGVLATVAARLRAQYPETNGPRLRVDVTSMQEELVGAVRPTLLTLLGAVGLVLLVACANVANLLLVRATTREREVATRAALGASRTRVARQMLAESVVLAVAGGVAGVLLAAAAVRGLRGLDPDVLPRAGEVALDGGALAFALVLSVGTGVLFGLAPALRLAGGDLQSVLRGAGRSVAGSAASNRARGTLVAGEVALSLLLLVGAGLLLRSFVRLQQVDPGFQAEHVLTARLALPRAAYPDIDRQGPAFQAALLERAAAIPGVRAAAVATGVPMTGSSYVTFEVAGRESQPGEDLQPFDVSEGYFRAMGVRLLRGRVIGPQDGPGRRASRWSTRRPRAGFWPGRDPIGARITVGDTTQYQTVVGVVANVRQEGLAAKPYPQLYGAIRQDPTRGAAGGGARRGRPGRAHRRGAARRRRARPDGARVRRGDDDAARAARRGPPARDGGAGRRVRRRGAPPRRGRHLRRRRLQRRPAHPRDRRAHGVGRERRRRAPAGGAPRDGAGARGTGARPGDGAGGGPRARRVALRRRRARPGGLRGGGGVPGARRAGRHVGPGPARHPRAADGGPAAGLTAGPSHTPRPLRTSAAPGAPCAPLRAE